MNSVWAEQQVWIREAVDVEVALFADEPSDRRKEVAEVQSVPPGGIEPPTPGSGMGVR